MRKDVDGRTVVSQEEPHWKSYDISKAKPRCAKHPEGVILVLLTGDCQKLSVELSCLQVQSGCLKSAGKLQLNLHRFSEGSSEVTSKCSAANPSQYLRDLEELKNP